MKRFVEYSYLIKNVANWTISEHAARLFGIAGKLGHDKAAERALTICRLIDKNIEDVRGMAFRLRPDVLIEP